MALKGLGVENGGFTFYWKIKHFSLCPLEEIKSPVFRVEELDNTEWSLRLHPCKESNIVLNIHRKGKDEGPICVLVDVRLFLLKANGEKVIQELKKGSFQLTYYYALQRKKSAIFEDEALFLSDDTLTVGCFIKKHLDNVSDSIECTAFTEISTERFIFNFPFVVSKQQHTQQTFTISKASVSKEYPLFKVVLETNRTIHNTEGMAVRIVMDKSSCDVSSKCKLSVEDTKCKTVFLFEGWNKYLANRDDQSWNLTNSITSRENIVDVSEDSRFILRCVLTVSDGTYSSAIKDLTYPISTSQLVFSNDSAKQSQMEKMKRLLEDSRLCDFTLQVGGEEFRIHKAVLGAMSPVFCAMFEQEMKEKESSVTVIEDIDASTIRKLIDFAYTESVENLEWESAIKLYGAADKYKIPELRQCCANYIEANLSVDNVIEALTISDMYQDTNLEKVSVDFVFTHAREVFRSDNWKTFIGNNVTVANRAMQDICIKFSSNQIS